ncbi:MAG: PTS sugar transporter subunit IIC [Defluviitaleaceae bacterium]|nr:PTS sugar transporter subunit IIC [Defluviitaleaceae bacterium]
MKVKEFLLKKDVVISLKRYGVEAMGAMTLGLFASLIMGLILSEIGTRVGIGFMVDMGGWARGATGYAIGVAVAFGLKAPPLVIFASAATGFVGNYLGGPAGALLAAIIGAELGKLVSKETKVDIIVTPATTLMTGMGVAMAIGPAIDWLMSTIGNFIMWATELMPALMGAIIAVVMGMALTGPISSAALAITLGLSGIAAGAAVAGCAANMVGFAVSSYRENKVGGLVSQGIGTSMLQLPNIIKNPRIWIPPIIASAIAGAVSAAVFGMENVPEGAGMGTSGLVGQFGAFTAMGFTWVVLTQVIIVHFIIPAVTCLLISEFMRKKGWIKFGDMKLEA